jgi:hypothetical protein
MAIGERVIRAGRGDGVNFIDQQKVYKSEQTNIGAAFSIPVLCSERGSFCCESSSRFIPGAAVRRPGGPRETPFSNYSGDTGTYDHCRKTCMAAFLMAGIVAGQAKTVCPTYIEKQRKKQQKTGSGFLMPMKHSLRSRTRSKCRWKGGVRHEEVCQA